ncbi:FkbM family methyltransferase [Pseudomonadota bacterium]
MQAHTGSLCFGIAKMLPDAQVSAFEPLPENYAVLQRLAKNIKLTTFNVAVGNEEGEETFYENLFSASSSALPMARTHKEEFPHTAGIREIRVPFWRLDNHRDKLVLESPVLLVLDVQGYEFEALKGAENMLTNVDIIICEISIDQLYEGHASFNEIYTWLHENGFNYSGDFDCLKSPIDGRVLQIDAIFTQTV